MIRSRNQLYTIVIIACVVGYFWLYFNLTNKLSTSVNVCMLKHITQIPCPSCGSTRAMISIANGEFVNALKLNPIGYLVAGIMTLSPLWILIDLGLKKNTFFESYQKIEIQLRRPQYAIPLVLLVVLNWMWNISKNL